MKKQNNSATPKNKNLKSYLENSAIKPARVAICESTMGPRKIFIIHEGFTKEEENKITLQDNGRYYFKPKEDTRHSTSHASAGWGELKDTALLALPWQLDTIQQWVKFQPHVTVITLGHTDIIYNKRQREGAVFVQAAREAIRQFVEAGRSYLNSEENSLSITLE